MYIKLIPLLAAALTLTACEKEIIRTEEVNQTNTALGNCEWTYDFFAGQNIPAGTITVSNDNNFIYVTYNTSGLALIYETHLYVGHPNDLPKNGAGNPKIGLFPYSETHNGVTSYTYAVPIDPQLQCFIVSAHASVNMVDEDGNPAQQETAWIHQCYINEKGSWAGYGKYCLTDCD